MRSCSARAYELDDAELDRLEVRVVASLRRGDLDRHVACAVVDGGSDLADLGRTIEARAFPGYDFETAMALYEERSIFLYTVDLEAGRVAHVKRIVVPLDEVSGGRTGVEVIDDRVFAAEESEHASLEDVLAHHGIVDVRRCLNLTTNVGTGREVRPTRERPYSLLSYKGVFEWGSARRYDHLFAYVNKDAVRSLGRVGVTGGLLLDREYHLPEPAGGYDLDYVAVHIDGGPATVRAFTVPDRTRPLTRVVALTELPVVVLLDEDDVVIDLTDGAAPEVGERLGGDATTEGGTTA